MTNLYYLPVFEKGSDQFVVLHDTFKGNTKEEAEYIGLGASIVECVLWGARFIHKVLEVDESFIAVEAYIDDTPIALVGGENYEREMGTPREMMN